MMIRRFENGDISTSGRQFIEGRAAAGAGVKHRLRLFLGEYFLDVSDGTPWFQSILGKTPQDVAEVQIKARILTAPGVRFIRSMDFESEAGQRRITVKAKIRTTEGDTDAELNESLI